MAYDISIQKRCRKALCSVGVDKLKDDLQLLADTGKSNMFEIGSDHDPLYYLVRPDVLNTVLVEIDHAANQIYVRILDRKGDGLQGSWVDL